MVNTLTTAPHFNDEELELIKNNIAKDFRDCELALFLHTCKQYNLDPLKKQIYGFRGKGNKVMTIVSIDGLRLIAERTGRYAPGRDSEFCYDANGNLLGSKVYVKKQTPDGTWHEVSATALLSEYKGNTPIWNSLTHVMLEKVAEARALRRCFPSDMGGLYSEDEMDQAKPATPAPSIVIEDKQYISEPTLKGLQEFTRDFPGLADTILAELNARSLSSIQEKDMKEVKNICITWRAEYYDSIKK